MPKNLSSLSNEKADELITKVLKNNVETDKLMDRYYVKMKKAITPLRAGSYMQLEFYILTMIRAEIQSNIPMIGELDKKVK
ncbi:MAG: hypothetical protein PSX36_02685 [bacterium]|nr:hypothetical protein [bacterium]